jgi:hypothetical protein
MRREVSIWRERVSLVATLDFGIALGFLPQTCHVSRHRLFIFKDHVCEEPMQTVQMLQKAALRLQEGMSLRKVPALVGVDIVPTLSGLLRPLSDSRGRIRNR